MSVINSEVAGFLKNSSMIRKMFEAGIELRKQYGAENVYDFSLGNPDLPPPDAVKQALENIVSTADKPFALGYMPNAGYPELRELQAEKISAEQGVKIAGSHVIMSCGAAGGINAFFRAVLTGGDEVMCPSPYFVEYGFYCGNYGASLKPVSFKDKDFSLDLAAFEASFTEKTRAVIINSPHNPTGRIYTREELNGLCDLMRKMEKKYNKVIYLVADEPYRFLNFDNVEIPSVFELYEHSVVIGSYSKNLSLAGERIGYVAVNPNMAEAAELISAVILTNRILGYVNAPVLAQKILLQAMNSQVDLEVYRSRRTAMKEVLDAAGIKCFMPSGAFYFFPESPIEDDKEFVAMLQKERVLAVPGSGFGAKGFFRLAFCVNENTIRASKDSFVRVMEQL